MSIKEIFNKQWIAILASLIFFLFGIGTIVGILMWMPHERTKFDIGFAVVGCLIGVFEMFEGYNILRTFKRRYK